MVLHPAMIYNGFLLSKTYGVFTIGVRMVWTDLPHAIPWKVRILKNCFSTLNLNFRFINVAEFTPDPWLFFQANRKRGAGLFRSVSSDT
jgi:hypothetical protein